MPNRENIILEHIFDCYISLNGLTFHTHNIIKPSYNQDFHPATHKIYNETFHFNSHHSTNFPLVELLLFSLHSHGIYFCQRHPHPFYKKIYVYIAWISFTQFCVSSQNWSKLNVNIGKNISKNKKKIFIVKFNPIMFRTIFV